MTGYAPDRPQIDRYPTRVERAIAPVPRTDPVVWSARGPEPGPLSRDELERFERDGFLLRPRSVAEEQLAGLRRELERLPAELSPDDPRVVREGGSGAVRSVFAPHLCSGLVADVVRSETVLPLARQLLGSDVYLHQARINFMPGFSGSGFYWHSDFETWHAEDGLPAIRTVSCSIALTENYPYNGALMVMPGSHHTFYPCVGRTPENHHQSSLVRQEIGVPDQETLAKAADASGIFQSTGPAGTAFWFDANLLHGSGSNITPFPRSNLFLVFNSVENAPVEPFAAARRRPEHIAARVPEPIREQEPISQGKRSG